MADIDDNEQQQTKIVIGDQTASAMTSSQILYVTPDGIVSAGAVSSQDCTQSVVGGNVSVNDDILHQAFQEAENGFVDPNSSVENIEEGQVIDTSSTVHYSTGQVISQDDEEALLNSIVQSVNNTFTGQDGVQYTIVKPDDDDDDDGSEQLLVTGQVNVADEQMDQDPMAALQEQIDAHVDDSLINDGTTEVEPTVEDNGSTVVEATEPPLGSSSNPIRIIQQGNQYTSLQQLTPEQLTHIMQVLQQQQVVKSTQQQGSTTLYSPQTNTKIVYRVIYPSDVKKEDASKKVVSSSSFTPIAGLRAAPATSASASNRGRGRGRGRPRKVTYEDDRTSIPDLSKEEKEKRKKMRPRTRSGRVSKPPKHMVKDYKHIHLLDWEEDYDDDDGGYSDFKPSSDEDDGEGDERGHRGEKGAYLLHGQCVYVALICLSRYLSHSFRGLARSMVFNLYIAQRQSQSHSEDWLWRSARSSLSLLRTYRILPVETIATSGKR